MADDLYENNWDILCTRVQNLYWKSIIVVIVLKFRVTFTLKFYSDLHYVLSNIGPNWVVFWILYTDYEVLAIFIRITF